MNTDLLFEITQTVLAVIVVVGTGYAVITQNSHVAEIVPFGSLILGYYFGRSVGKLSIATNGNGNGKSGVEKQ